MTPSSQHITNHHTLSTEDDNAGVSSQSMLTESSTANKDAKNLVGMSSSSSTSPSTTTTNTSITSSSASSSIKKVSAVNMESTTESSSVNGSSQHDRDGVIRRLVVSEEEMSMSSDHGMKNTLALLEGNASIDHLASATSSPIIVKTPTTTTLSSSQPSIPVTAAMLVEMDYCFHPPTVDVVHELFFNAKLKLSSEVMHRICHLTTEPTTSSHHNYWSALAMELDLIKSRKMCKDLSMMPLLMEEIKEMLLHLYPRSQMLHDLIVPHMESDFLVQQIQCGYLDLGSISKLLGELIKSNCAPKRDAMVDKMVEMGVSGQWIEMLQTCLELMKLMKFVC